MAEAEPATLPVTSVLYRNTTLNTLGESPIYRSTDHTLHWIDILSKPSTLSILPLSPDTSTPLGPARVITTSCGLTCIRFIKNQPGKYIAATRGGIGILDEETGEVEVLRELIGAEVSKGWTEWTMNDGAVDPQGRFWVGDEGIGAGRGRLWRFDPDGGVKLMQEGLLCGNGIGWSLDGRYMFFNDSGGHRLWRYDFDGKTGDISNQTVVFDGLPDQTRSVFNDGMVIDVEGNLWVTLWNDYSIIQITPEGKRLKKLTFPAKCITCPAWGGQNNNVLFVVSGMAWNELPGDEGGHVFKFNTGVKGVVNHEFAGLSV